MSSSRCHDRFGGRVLVVVSLMCFFLVEFFFFFLGGRVARPCVARVHSNCLERRPASALICIEPGPLGDASGIFSLVLAFVNVVLLTVFGVVCAPSC